MLEQIYTSSKEITCGASMSSLRMAYIKSWDAMVYYDRNYPGKVAKLFRDGSMATMISGCSVYLTLHTREAGRHIFQNTYGVVGDFWGTDEISGNYYFNQVLNENFAPIYEASQSQNYIDDKRHLLIYAYVNRMIHFIDLANGVEVAAMTLPGIGNQIYDHIAWAGEGKVIAIHFATGNISLIDYINRAIIWSSTIRPCKMAAYDCVHHLVITVEADKLVRVYTIYPVPAALSNPVFVPATAQHRLMGSPVRTRLTGSAGEICPDYWVHWSLLGLPAKGELLKDKSKTDAGGYAENYYFGPRAAGEVGAETIRVSVKVPS